MQIAKIMTGRPWFRTPGAGCCAFGPAQSKPGR